MQKLRHLAVMQLYDLYLFFLQIVFILSVMLLHIQTQVSVLYLLTRADMCVDIFEHRLQRGVITNAQILYLDLSLSGPAVRNLRRS